MKARIKLYAACLCLLLLSGAGCSYVVDAVEGYAMKRSSFSIDVTPLGGDQYKVDWSNIYEVKNDDGKISDQEFAGYEIYITETPNDEFSGYKLLAGPYNLGVSGAIAMESLYDQDTRTATLTISKTSGSVYYIRVGAVVWSQAKDEDKSSDWPGWTDTYGSINETFYSVKTSLDRISGGRRVQF